MSNRIIEQMLAAYDLNSYYDKKNAMKEVMQEIVLCGLSRSGFFKSAAFYGGTALRIFYGLDRFSEDLDFSLVKKEETFDLEKYFAVLKREVHAFGLNVTISEKEKVKETDIQSAFVKGNTREHLMLFYDRELAGTVSANEMIKIKFEVDTNAGKIHAVICRGWKNRVKGRDLYDYVFYLGRGAKVNLPHLAARLKDSGYINPESGCSLTDVKGMLCEKFQNIDYEQAKQDVVPFIRDHTSLALWSADFFMQITELLQVNE